jgi:hypothetical protein
MSFGIFCFKCPRDPKTVSRYDNALCDFQFALAANDRALGKPSIDIAGVQ